MDETVHWKALLLIFLQFVNPEDKTQESTGALIWGFEILRRNCSAAVVQAFVILLTSLKQNATAAISSSSRMGGIRTK